MTRFSMRSSEGPEYQNMEQKKGANEACNYIENMSNIFAVAGIWLGGFPCFAAANCLAKDVKGGKEHTSASECFTRLGLFSTGCISGGAFKAAGCGLAVVTAPVVACCGQPEAIKKHGEESTRFLKRVYN